MLEKKAGGIIKKLIDWQLFNNNDLVIDLKDVECSYDNSVIIFDEDDVKNTISFINKTYTRVSKEYTMVIDFNNKTCCFKFENNEECTLSVDGCLTMDDNTVIVNYCYDTDLKKIIIKFKEV